MDDLTFLFTVLKGEYSRVTRHREYPCTFSEHPTGSLPRSMSEQAMLMRTARSLSRCTEIPCNACSFRSLRIIPFHSCIWGILSKSVAELF